MSQPTIKDVSRLAGVSIGTVSNVVNGHPNISKATRERVENAISMLGYTPNRAAKSLRGQTGLLGYRMPDASKLNSAMDVFLHRVVECAGSLGFEVLLFTPKPGQSELDAYREVLQRGGVDAFVLAGIEYDDPRVEFLEEARVPFAAFGRTASVTNGIAVDIDGAAGTKAAVEHLVRSGRERIAFLGWPEGSLTGDERFAGWQSAIREAGLQFDESAVIRAEDSYETGSEIGPRLAADGFDAVVCVSDTFALGVIAGLNRAGMVPGRDLAVVGFDDIAAAALVEPGLSSIHQPMVQVGETLVTQLAHLIAGKSPAQSQILIEPRLVKRASSSPEQVRPT